MAKHDKNNHVKNNPENNAPSTVETPAVETAPSVVRAPVAETSGEIVVAPTAELAAPDDGETMSHLSKELPHLTKLLAKARRVDPGELEEAVNQLPEDQQNNFNAMIARMSVEKPGVHLSETRFQVPDIRMYHGSGNDENRPQTAPEGCIYTSDTKVLAVPEIFKNQWPGVPQRVTVAVIGIYQVRTYWAPKDKSGNVTLPPGVELKGNQPICRSQDRKKGDRYGDCSACPYRPWKDGKFDRDVCRDEMHLYVTLPNMSGIYRWIVSGASIKTGATPVQKKALSWAAPWSHFFTFSTSKQSNGNQKWYQLDAAVAQDDTGQPAAPTPEQQRVYALFCRQIETELYYPGLANIYSRGANAPVGETNADMAALINSAKSSSGAMPDYSKNNV